MYFGVIVGPAGGGVGRVVKVALNNILIVFILLFSGQSHKS